MFVFVSSILTKDLVLIFPLSLLNLLNIKKKIIDALLAEPRGELPVSKKGGK